MKRKSYSTKTVQVSHHVRSSSQSYFNSLIDPELSPTAFKVALIVGSILFIINHGWAVLQGQMTLARWLSGGLTYIVPYMVNTHGQHICKKRIAQHSSLK